MQAACPDETPITPPGRLEAMEKRLQAMIDAAKTVKPALESFYARSAASRRRASTASASSWRSRTANAKQETKKGGHRGRPFLFHGIGPIPPRCALPAPPP